jgi:hypothetical protein
MRKGNITSQIFPSQKKKYWQRRKDKKGLMCDPSKKLLRQKPESEEKYVSTQTFQ